MFGLLYCIELSYRKIKEVLEVIETGREGRERERQTEIDGDRETDRERLAKGQRG